MDRWDGLVIPLDWYHCPNIAVIAHDGLWEHTILTLFTLLTLFKRFTLLALALCMNS